MEKPFGNKRYTVSGDDAIERHIDRIVNGVVQSLTSIIKPVSVFLSGSLAKGEITAYRVEDRIEIISDFEIGIVDWNWTKRPSLRKIEHLLAHKYGIDLTLLFFLPRRFTRCAPFNWSAGKCPLSIEQYELIKGSFFVYGKDYKKCCPEVKSGYIPLWEGLRLLFNRMAELVGVLSSGETAGDKFFKACDKLLIASGDAMLLCTGMYHHLYMERKRLFEENADSIKEICMTLSNDDSRLIIDAYERKIHCKKCDMLSGNELLSLTLSVSDKAFMAIVYCMMKISFSSAEQFREQYLVHPDLARYCRTDSRLSNLACFFKRRGRIKPFSAVQFIKPVSIQHRIYADIYQWLMGSFKSEWSATGSKYTDNRELMLEAKIRFDCWKNFVA